MNLRLLAVLLLMSALILGATSTAWSAEEQNQEAATTGQAMGISIQDAVVCQDVVERTPVGSGDVFAKETSKVMKKSFF